MALDTNDGRGSRWFGLRWWYWETFRFVRTDGDDGIMSLLVLLMFFLVVLQLALLVEFKWLAKDAKRRFFRNLIRNNEMVKTKAAEDTTKAMMSIVFAMLLLSLLSSSSESHVELSASPPCLTLSIGWSNDGRDRDWKDGRVRMNEMRWQWRGLIVSLFWWSKI